MADAENPFLFLIAMADEPEMSREGREVLKLWKGCDETELKRNFPRYVCAGTILPEVLKKLNVERARENQQMLYAWEKMVAPEIQVHAQPQAIRNGTLFIRVDSSAWMSEIIRFHKRSILQNMQACFGKAKIKKISFKM